MTGNGLKPRFSIEALPQHKICGYIPFMKPKRDIELAYQFPAHISDESRVRVLRLGILFTVAQLLIFLLFVLL